MRMRAALFLIALLAGWLATPAWADDTLVVIVHRDTPVESLTRAELINIFMGRFKKLPSGPRAQVFDNEASKARFYSSLVNKSLPEIHAYWARLTFSGQTSPPRQVAEKQILELVSKTPGAITYIDRRLLNDSVKVVFELAP